MKRFHHKLYIIYPFFMVILMALIIYNISSRPYFVTGLEPIPCIDPSKPLIQSYTFYIKIRVQGKFIPLDPNIGHDPAKCLREIFTDDSSGRVFVNSTWNKSYTLGDFFAVWRKPFTSNQLFNNFSDNYHSISVYKNGNLIDTFENTLLVPNQTFEISFE